jgi:hypothetical protein
MTEVLTHASGTEGSSMSHEQQFQGELTALAGWQARALAAKLAAGETLGLSEQRVVRTARRRAARAAGTARVQMRAAS